MDDDVSEGETPAEAALRPQTLAYLDTLAAASFKRQEELDESVWRSLPFFAAALALAVTIVSRVAASAPLPTLSVYPVVVNVALVAALLSFGWALRWFYEVLRPRGYEYPPTPTAVRDFAARMAGYHAQRDDLDRDSAVVNELRQMMTAAHAAATDHNMLHNRTRLEARGQLILFLTAGFLMTLTCEAIIYGHDLIGQVTIGAGNSDDRRSAADLSSAAVGRETRRAEGVHGGAGREVPPLDRHAQDRTQAVTRAGNPRR